MKTSFLALAAGLSVMTLTLRAEDPPVPAGGFPASRYQTLWSKSPFAVATAEAGQEASPDYTLAGIANVDGVSYASVIDNHNNQEHFLLSSAKPTRGLTLTSITRGQNGSDTLAVVQKDGQLITLKMQPAPAASAPLLATPAPSNMTPQIVMPGASAFTPSAMRPFTRIHRPPIHLPPQPQAAPAPPPPPPAP